jgi:sugar-phosphatase
VEYWYARHPWKGPTRIEVEAEINRGVIELIMARGDILPGAVEAIDLLHRAEIPLGIASSSSSELIGKVVDKLGVRDKIRVLQSAEHEPYGKPHPAVYIECARRLNVAPDRCLAIEDSPAGLLAAKAARMSCIVVPAEVMREDRRYCIADGMLSSLNELNLELLARL